MEVHELGDGGCDNSGENNDSGDEEDNDAMRNLVGLQGTCSKAASDTELALLAHLKFPDDSEWQQCESCVGNDVENAEIRPESILHPISDDVDVGQLRHQWSYLIDTFIANQPPRFRCAALEGSDEFRGKGPEDDCEA